MGRVLRLGGDLGDRPLGHARGRRHGHRAHPPRHDAHPGPAPSPVGARRADHDRRPPLERARHPLGRPRRRGRDRAALLDLRGRPRPSRARRAARRGARADAGALAGRAVRVRGRALSRHAHRHDAAARDRAAAAHPHVGRRGLAQHEVDAPRRALRRVDPQLRAARCRRHRSPRAAAHLHARDRGRGDRLDPRRARAARARRPARSTSCRRARPAASTGWRMPRWCAGGPTPGSRGGSSPTGTCRPRASPSTRASACARGRPHP